MKLSVRKGPFFFFFFLYLVTVRLKLTFFSVQTCGLCNLHDGSCPFLYGDIAWGAQHTENCLHLTISEALWESVLNE